MTPLFRDVPGSLGGKIERPITNGKKRAESAKGTERGTRRPVLRFLLFSALGVGSGIALTGKTSSAAPPTIHRGPTRVGGSREDAVNQAMSLEASSLQALMVVQDTHGALTTKIKVDDETWTLVLRRHSLRANDFQVLVQAEPNGELVPVQPPPVRTYRGSVLEVPDALVSASFVDGKLTATIGTRSGIYGIQPVSKLGLDDEAGKHVIYRADDWVNREGYVCGTTDALRVADPADESEPGSVAGTGLQVADLAVDADVEFFQANGSSIENTVIDIETVLDTVEFIYERDTEITYEVTTVIVRTAEPDPYSSTNNVVLLCQFVSEWNSTPQTFIRRDTAHLFTGKNINGNVIGTAFLGVVCNLSGSFCGFGIENLAYGFSESTFTSTFTARVALTAHEIGHNWRAFHCNGDSDCHIMCSVLGSCSGIAGDNLKFGTRSRNSITNFRNTRPCLSDLADPRTLLFFDSFPSGSLDTAKWSYNQGGLVTDLAVNEPSPPFSLSLDAGGSQEFRDDEIRSNFVAIGGATAPVTLSYFTQHRGVGLGERLFVEYWSSDRIWRQLNQIVSDDVDQSAFDFHTHMLPDDAKHSEFRVRFRTEVSSSSDDWFIDDMLIRTVCESDAECNDGEFCNGQEICVDTMCVPGPAACAPDESCDENIDLCFAPNCAPASVTAEANRYLTITPAAGVDPVGLLVAPLCDPSSAKYVGPPDGPDNTAFLVDDVAAAAFLTPEGWNGAVRITGTDIVPATDYFVSTDCGTPGQPVLSQAATATTQLWGDVVGVFENGAWTPSDGNITILDILAIVDRFLNVSTAPPIYRVDLIGVGPGGIECRPDQNIDIVDVLTAVDGFLGVGYADSTMCPEPCPPGTLKR